MAPGPDRDCPQEQKEVAPTLPLPMARLDLHPGRDELRGFELKAGSFSPSSAHVPLSQWEESVCWHRSTVQPFQNQGKSAFAHVVVYIYICF